MGGDEKGRRKKKKATEGWNRTRDKKKIHSASMKQHLRRDMGIR